MMGRVKERLIQGYYCTDCGKELGKPEEFGQRCCLECDNFRQSIGDSLRTINTTFDTVDRTINTMFVAVEIACEKKENNSDKEGE